MIQSLYEVEVGVDYEYDDLYACSDIVVCEDGHGFARAGDLVAEFHRGNKDKHDIVRVVATYLVEGGDFQHGFHLQF